LDKEHAWCSEACPSPSACSPSPPRRQRPSSRPAPRAEATRSTRARATAATTCAYSIKLDYEPQNEQLAGDVTIEARTTQNLSSFNLDFRDFKISSLTVNGSPAAFSHKGQELTITPAEGLRDNRAFTVRVVYAGHANYVLDPDKSKDGCIPTDDGAFVVNEPQGAPTWIPVNDSLKDFATWDFAITVPEGRTALANVPDDCHERRLRAEDAYARKWPARVQRGRSADAALRPEGAEPGPGV
jgi:aminopeptidase N